MAREMLKNGYRPICYSIVRCTLLAEANRDSTTRSVNICVDNALDKAGIGITDVKLLPSVPWVRMTIYGRMGLRINEWLFNGTSTDKGH